MAITERAKRHVERFRKKRDSRGVWDNHWDDLSRVQLPRRLGFSSSTVPGESRTEDLYDGTPMQAANGLANAIGGMLRPDGRKTAFIKTVEDADENTDEAKEWLADSEKRLDDELKNPKSRFRQATGECDLDLVVLGTACVFEGEGKNLNHLLFQSVHLKDAYPVFDEDGTAAGMYRRRNLTTEQAVDEFGLANVSENVREKYRKEEYEDRADYLHCVLRRREGRPDAVFARNFPFTNLWIDISSKDEVKDGGFRSFPFIVPRWDTSSGEEYGRSPGMIALPDSNTAQAQGETILVAGQRAADPPMATPFDGFFTEYNTFPGGLVYYDVETAKAVGRIPMQPLESGTNLPISRDMQQDTRNQIFAAFFRNVLNLPVEGPQMTATEVIQRKEEFLREIGPVFGRLETDYTAPMIERAFAILFRAGAFAPVPPSLQGRRVRFEYESPVKRIRQQIESAAARLWVQEHINMATELQRPEILDPINFDEYSKFTHEAAGLPHEILNGDDRIEAKRAARDQELQQAQERAEIASTVETMDVAAAAAQKAGLTQKAA